MARIELNTINANKPPRITTTNATANAYQSNRVNRDRQRAMTKTTPPMRQSIGVTVRISIQNRGVVDHPSLELLCAYHTEVPMSQTAEQTSNATESINGETRLRPRERIFTFYPTLCKKVCPKNPLRETFTTPPPALWAREFVRTSSSLARA